MCYSGCFCVRVILGTLKAGVKNACVGILVCAKVHICGFQDFKSPYAPQLSVHAADPNATRSPGSLWLDLTLSASGGHTLMCEHGPLCLVLKGR